MQNIEQGPRDGINWRQGFNEAHLNITQKVRVIKQSEAQFFLLIVNSFGPNCRNKCDTFPRVGHFPNIPHSRHLHLPDCHHIHVTESLSNRTVPT